MIDYVIKAFDSKRTGIQNALSQLPDDFNCDYFDILKATLKAIGEFYNGFGYEASFDIDQLTKIDFGDYQGTLVFVVPLKSYQPDENETFTTYVSYGSCSGCDTLQSIQSQWSTYDLTEEEKAKNKEGLTKDYFTLALHMIQRMKTISNEPEQGGAK